MYENLCETLLNVVPFVCKLLSDMQPLVENFGLSEVEFAVTAQVTNISMICDDVVVSLVFW